MAKYETQGILTKYKTNLSYKIITKSHEWEVRRHDSDFFLLRQIFLKKFPFLLVPPLPGSSEKKFTRKSLQKRMKLMQRFLDHCIRVQEFRAVVAFVAFVSDATDFQEECKAEDKAHLLNLA